MSARKALALVALALGFSCAIPRSPPTDFFALEPVPGREPRPLTGPPLALADVEIPETLDRQAMVRRAGEHRYDLRGTERWLAPFRGMVQHVLALDLARRLEPGQVVLPGEPPPEGALQLVHVSIEEFAADAAGEVRLAARWTLLEAGAFARERHRASLRAEAASGEAADVARAMSRALDELAGRIVETVRERAAARGRRPDSRV